MSLSSYQISRCSLSGSPESVAENIHKKLHISGTEFVKLFCHLRMEKLLLLCMWLVIIHVKDVWLATIHADNDTCTLLSTGSYRFCHSCSLHFTVLKLRSQQTCYSFNENPMSWFEAETFCK